MRLSFVPDSIRLSPSPGLPETLAGPAGARLPADARAPIRLSRALIAGLLTALLLTVLNIALPRLGKSIANSLPASWIRDASQQAEGAPSRQDQANTTSSPAITTRFEQLKARFGALSAPEAGAPPYRLVLSNAPGAAARIMSLPSGDIVLSEGFLVAVPDPDLQIALLCVELGHLQLRHALRNAVQHKLLQLGVTTLLADETGSINALRAGLAQADYTPEQLLAADRYALDMLRANRFRPELLIRALRLAPGNTSPAQLQPSASQHRRYLSQRIEALRAEHRTA